MILYTTPNTKYTIPNSPSKNLDAQSQMPNTQHRVHLIQVSQREVTSRLPCNGQEGEGTRLFKDEDNVDGYEVDVDVGVGADVDADDVDGYEVGKE